MKKTINFNQDNKKESMSLKILKFFSGDFWFNKYVLIFAFIYILSCVGGTYAYLAFSAENSNTVVGVVGSPNLDLVVQSVVPSSSGNTGVMVPQLESALGTAISSQYNCVDGNGNVVCKVYRATVTNSGNTNIKIRGDVSFTGISSMSNLKWKRITNATTIGSYSSNTASTSDVSFESEKMLEVDESETYYFVIWIDEIGETQTDSGTFRMTIKFNSADGNGITSTIDEDKTITFYNGNSSIGTQNVDNSSTVSLNSWSSLGGSVLSGYTGWSFAGWTTSRDIGEVEYTNGSNITVDDDISLYAVYSRGLIVSYNANGGSGSMLATTKTIYISSTSTTTSDQSVTLAGNRFEGSSSLVKYWRENSINGEAYSPGAIYNPNLVYNSENFEVVMYAEWSKYDSDD